MAAERAKVLYQFTYDRTYDSPKTGTCSVCGTTVKWNITEKDEICPNCFSVLDWVQDTTDSTY